MVLQRAIQWASLGSMRYVGQKEPSKEDLKSHGRTATHTCHPSESCALLELHFSPFAISYSTLAQWTPRGNGQLSLIWILNPFYSEIVFWNYFTTAWRQIFRNDKDKSFHFFGAHLFFPISCNSSVCSGIAVVLIELGLTQFNPRKITESEASIFPIRIVSGLFKYGIHAQIKLITDDDD